MNYIIYLLTNGEKTKSLKRVICLIAKIILNKSLKFDLLFKGNKDRYEITYN